MESRNGNDAVMKLMKRFYELGLSQDPQQDQGQLVGRAGQSSVASNSAVLSASTSLTFHNSNLRKESGSTSVSKNDLLATINGNVAIGQRSIKYSLANGVDKDDSSDSGLSAAELLKQYQEQRDAKLAVMEEEAFKSKNQLEGPKQFNRGKVPKAIRDQVQALPICSRKEELIKMVQKNQMVIVIGDTGSGKSTQIPQYLVDAGFATKGKIGITQPRRVAAKSLADRVSKECGVKVGTLVGYAVRFEKAVSDNTQIKYMTDGLLVKECSIEPNLDSYSAIIIDEAHERSIHTDVCFGLLKRAAKRRPDLKIIISSATLEMHKFSAYFNNAPVFQVSGRGFDVDIKYEPKGEADYVQGVVDTIFSIHRTQGEGDILVFLTGQDEIEETWDLLENNIVSKRLTPEELLILPCYGGLPFEDQQKIFVPTPKGCRKIVLATNIAETSLTIDGIVFVIDCGYFKQSEYNSKTGITALVKHKISKHQAIQRTGRAGRTRPGKCYRLYSKYVFDAMTNANIPEIKRCNLESVVLDLIAMGIRNPVTFEFMDPPTRDAILEALEHLKELQALNPDDLGLTLLGKRMSQFPLDPSLSRVLMESVNLGCSADILKIVSILSTQYSRLFIRPKKKRTEADAAKAKFNHSDGDHLTLLTIFDQWIAMNYSQGWCKHNFIQYRYLCEADEIRKQLQDVLQSHNLPELTGRHNWDQSERIRRAFTAGYFRQIARKCPRGHAYTTTNRSLFTQEDLYLQRSCSLFPNVPPKPYLIYHEVVKTSKAFIRGAIEVKMEWVKEYAPQYYKSTLFSM